MIFIDQTLSEINAFIQCSVSCRSSSVNRLSSNQTKTSKMVHHFSAFTFCCCFFLFVCLTWRYAADYHTIEFIILRMYANFLYHQPKLLCLLPWQTGRKEGKERKKHGVLYSNYKLHNCRDVKHRSEWCRCLLQTSLYENLPCVVNIFVK